MGFFQFVANIIISKIESKSLWCITTKSKSTCRCVSLFQRSKIKSQPMARSSISMNCCGKYHYFKDRKSNHNSLVAASGLNRCGKYHYFKDRKQITTYRRLNPTAKVVANIIISKIESKSQLIGICHDLIVVFVVANIIISKIESKSQLNTLDFVMLGCGKYHYFKDRKQITTAWTAFQGLFINESCANIIISKIESKSQHSYF